MAYDAREAKSDADKALEALAEWTPKGTSEELVALWNMTERSLDEVKDLTEYEDTKAQRILTAMAFLAGLAGALFAVASKSLSDAGLLHNLSTSFNWNLLFNFLTISLYGVFALYAVLLSSGAALVVFSVMPRFNVNWGNKPQSGKPKSFLFFEKIAAVSKQEWVHAYSGSSIAEIRNQYIRNSIWETHLVADKISHKLQRLQPGVKVLFVSTLILIVWIPIALSAIVYSR